MRSKAVTILVALFIVTSLFLTTGFSVVSLTRQDMPMLSTASPVKFPFKDVKGHPAEAAIIEMYAENVMKGYDDASFKPNKPVTFLEAVVMVDKLLWGKPIPSDGKSDNYLNEQFNIPAWAVPYVASALRNNILQYNEVQNIARQQPLTRQDSAILAVRALDLSNQVKRKKDTPLPFSDANRINEDARGYVVIAFDHKIINGYPDGTFQPADPISRGEMAVILSRILQQTPNNYPEEITGFIKSINPLTTTVSLVYNEDKESDIKLPEQCLYYLDDKPAVLEDLTAGNHVRIVTTETGKITVVLARSVAPDNGANLSAEIVNASTAPAEIQQWLVENQITENYLVKQYKDGLYFLVSRGEKMYSGYSVEITKITSTTDSKGIHYRIWLDKSDPARNAIKLPVISYPSALVRIKAPEQPVAGITFVNKLNQVITEVDPTSLGK